jgi:tagatose-1,6-bisphosphate aldolase non-catalytic subunit AgaZ/GatZ
MKFKLGFGPMSYEIVDLIGEYTSEQKRNIMLIASRNQIDSNSGYVMTTKDLNRVVYKNPHLMLCRDHCGPYFLDSEKTFTVSAAVEATKKTIGGDIEAGFDLIHIDTSRCDDQYLVAEELIKFCLNLNPNIKFEFGTEENVGVAAGIEKYKSDVEFAKQFPNMTFVVAQTGSLVMEDRQVGTFDSDVANQLSLFGETSGIGLKEHNADYLDADQIKLRKSSGVHAMNIAPQLGVIQTETLLSLCRKFDIDSRDFKKLVLDSGKWKKWYINCADDKKIVIAGHYCFNSDQYKNIIEDIDQHTVWRNEIRTAIFQVLDLYFDNFV